MAKSKEKIKKVKSPSIKKVKSPSRVGIKTSSTLPARPTFQIDDDLEERSSPMRENYVDDEQSVKSSASKKVTKKVKKISYSPKGRPNNVDDDVDVDVILAKKGSKKKKMKTTQSESPTTIGYNDTDDKSVRSSGTKKKKKKGLKLTSSKTKGGGTANNYDDEISIRSEAKKVRKSKKKKKSKSDDDNSVDTTRSSRSNRSKKSTKKSSRTKQTNSYDTLSIDGMILNVEKPSLTDQRQIYALERENAALLEETANIRRQLNEAEKSLKKASLEQESQQAKFDQIKELEMAQIESNELKMDIEEYEDAVIEKDELIQKLTEAVDAQLDKVEYLEIKLVRAEEEFCKIEEEMKESEDVIEELRSESPDDGNRGDGDDCPKRGEIMTNEDILIKLEERERNIEEREQDLLEKEDEIRERENLLQQDNEELRTRILKRRESFNSDTEIDDDDSLSGERERSAVDELKANILEIEAKNNDIMEENECLRQHDTEITSKQKVLAQQREEELKLIHNDVDKKMTDINIENEILRHELDDLKQRKNADIVSGEREMSAVDELKEKILEIEAKNNDIMEENECLRQHDTEITAKQKMLVQQREEELKLIHNDVDNKKMTDINIENEILRQELDDLKQRKNADIVSGEREMSAVDELKEKILEIEATNNDIMEENECLREHDAEITAKQKMLVQQREEELILIHNDIDKKMTDINIKNEILRQELDDLKQRKNADIVSGEREMSAVDELKAKILEIEATNNDIMEENECLREHDAEITAKQKMLVQQREEELKLIHHDIDKKMTDINIENEILRQELDDLKQRKNADNEALRQQIEELRKQKNHLEATSRHNSRHTERMESMGIMETESVKSFEYEEDCELELEVEIAELREKIVEQEDHSRRQKQEIATVFIENEEVKQELQEREIEFRDLENQLSTTKETSTQRMNQKDETITFMQKEMMKIMQEKHQLDKQLRDKKLDLTQTQLTKNCGGKEIDEAERARIEAINIQLRELDNDNRELNDELKETEYNNSLRLKEKQSIILDLQEELSDAKWELGAREKGADYVTLLKDRKERKRELDKARKELKISKEKILELELQNNEFSSNKKDLEKEIESLNKNAISMDSGEHISGLKRQIKSLKQHNTALEQKLGVESRDAQDKLGEKEAKVRILEFELEKFRKPTQTAIRGVISEFIPSFGRNSVVDENPATRTSTESNDCSDHYLGEEYDEGGIDKAVDSKITNDLTTDSQTPNNDVKSSTDGKIENTKGTAKDKEKSKNTAGTRTIWNLFSPRKGLSKVVKKNKNPGLSLSIWDSTMSGDDDIDIQDNKRESTIDSSNDLVDNGLEIEVDASNITSIEMNGIQQMEQDFANEVVDEGIDKA